MLGYLAKMGVFYVCFGGVIVVDRVVNVVFRRSLFGAQKIHHSFRIYFFPFWEMVPGQAYKNIPLYQSVLLKSLIFVGLVLVFHVIEEA